MDVFLVAGEALSRDVDLARSGQNQLCGVCVCVVLCLT